jgi:hypothetical protein
MKSDDYAKAIIAEGQRRGITPKGIQIALATALVESNLKMYANEADPPSMKFPYDAVGCDHKSVGAVSAVTVAPIAYVSDAKDRHEKSESND